MILPVPKLLGHLGYFIRAIYPIGTDSMTGFYVLKCQFFVANHKCGAVTNASRDSYILRAVTDAENGNARNPYNLRPSASLKPVIVTARSIALRIATSKFDLAFCLDCYNYPDKFCSACRACCARLLPRRAQHALRLRFVF
jgi:hypothetical protein